MLFLLYVCFISFDLKTQKKKKREKRRRKQLLGGVELESPEGKGIRRGISAFDRRRRREERVSGGDA
jgi:hypothetical protein